MRSRLGLKYLSMWYGYPGWSVERFRIDWAHVISRIILRFFLLLAGNRPPTLKLDKLPAEKASKKRKKAPKESTPAEKTAPGSAKRKKPNTEVVVISSAATVGKLRCKIDPQVHVCCAMTTRPHARQSLRASVGGTGARGRRPSNLRLRPGRPRLRSPSGKRCKPKAVGQAVLVSQSRFDTGTYRRSSTLLSLHSVTKHCAYELDAYVDILITYVIMCTT